MHSKKYFITTFGCQMNSYDSGRLGALLNEDGWEETKQQSEADLLFYNTCSIREKAAQRIINTLDNIRHLKKNKPELIIVVGGCVAEQEGKALLERVPWVDLVVGPQHLPEIPQLLSQVLNNNYKASLTGSGDKAAWSRENLIDLGRNTYSVTDEYPNIDIKSDILGFVTIMQGCNNFCSYCVVPYLRGPEISREHTDIIDEIKMMIDNGVKDVTLLGQNVNSYGLGMKGSISFPRLLEKVAATGIQRLRFTTSHPKDFSPELVNLFSSLPPLCESLHLPVQSGSDKILKSMRRVYNRDQYLRLVDDLRRAQPDITLTTDIIVGFPGETEKYFLETVSLIETVGYDAMFSFKYSDRPQTKSLNFPDKVEEEEKSRRLTYLQNLQKKITLSKNRAHVGQVHEILVEKKSERYQGQLTGRARNFKLVHFDGPETLIEQFVKVEITDSKGVTLTGKRLL